LSIYGCTDFDRVCFNITGLMRRGRCRNRRRCRGSFLKSHFRRLSFPLVAVPLGVWEIEGRQRVHGATAASKVSPRRDEWRRCRRRRRGGGGAGRGRTRCERTEPFVGQRGGKGDAFRDESGFSRGGTVGRGPNGVNFRYRRRGSVSGDQLDGCRRCRRCRRARRGWM